MPNYYAFLNHRGTSETSIFGRAVLVEKGDEAKYGVNKCGWFAVDDVHKGITGRYDDPQTCFDALKNMMPDFPSRYRTGDSSLAKLLALGGAPINANAASTFERWIIRDD